jgi:hypothetical protein
MSNPKNSFELDRRDEMILMIIAVLTPLIAIPAMFGA